MFVRIALSLTILICSKLEASTESSLKKAHKDLFRSVSHLGVEFEQTSFRKLRNKKISRTGSALFSQPNKFKWVYTDKLLGIEEYYYDGSRFSHFVQRENLLTIYGSDTGLGKELQKIVDLILNTKDLLESYQPSDVKKLDTMTEVTLNPKDPMQSDIERIFIKISNKKKYIEQVKLSYQDGNYTAFVFSNPKTSPISASLYKFNGPKTVKIRTLR